MTQSEFQALVVVADCYTPILLLIALFEVGRSWIQGNKLHFVQLVYATVLVYVLMFADIYFQLWATASLDYSTHSAAAFALVSVIGLRKSALYKLVLAVSIVAYGNLMNLLNYHSWSDMLTTVAFIALCLIPVLRLAASPKVSIPAIAAKN